MEEKYIKKIKKDGNKIKKNKYILYIYEPKESIFRIIIGLVIGLLSMVLIVILFKYGVRYL